MSYAKQARAVSKAAKPVNSAPPKTSPAKPSCEKPATVAESVAIATLRLDAKNANRGTARGAEMLDRSLAEHGAGRSVLVDRSGNIIAGNKTVEAARRAGYERVVIVPSDGKALIAVQRSDLDINSKKARALAIADNRTSEIGLDWNPDALRKFAPEDLGEMFSENELKKLLEQGPETFPELDENIPIQHRCPKCGYEWSGKPG